MVAGKGLALCVASELRSGQVMISSLPPMQCSDVGSHRFAAVENRGMQLGVLGPLQVSSADRVWSPGGPKERRLLAILVLHLGEVVSVEALADALWEGAPPRSAVKTLQVYVTRLRAALTAGQADGDVVRTVGRGYRLTVDRDAVDAYVFVTLVRRARWALDEGAPGEAERYLVEAFALWRGEPYGEFADGGWFAAEAQRLIETRLAGLEVRLAAGLAVGGDADVVAEAQALCAAHPLHEQFWVHLVTALYRCGRQADALAALRRVRAVLAEEIGADPGVELRTLEQRVLRQDPTLAAPAHPHGAAPLPAELDPAAGRYSAGRRSSRGWTRRGPTSLGAGRAGCWSSRARPAAGAPGWWPSSPPGCMPAASGALRAGRDGPSRPR